MSTIFSLIKELTELSGPVGQEQSVLDCMAKKWGELGAKIERSRIGNVMATVPGKGPKLLLLAHADELCYLVRSIHKDGFLWLAGGQGWQRSFPNRELLAVGQRVNILSKHGPIPGYIATATGHLAALTQTETKEITWDQIWVDTGLSKQTLEEKGVHAGTRIVWDTQAEQLGNNVVSKALDDRLGLAILTQVLAAIVKKPLNAQITVAASVQEEIGTIGAYALASKYDFDAAIVLEIGLSGDIPSVKQDMMPVALGKGPVLVHKDGMVHYHHGLSEKIATIAEENSIPLQHAVFGRFGSDGSALMKADIPTALLAFPTRYTHTPFEMANLDDISNLVQLLIAVSNKMELATI